jgi:Sigma-70, region 4
MMASMMVVEDKDLLRDPDPARADGMEQRYRDGATLQTIGDEYNLTRERVRQILAKRGISLQDRGPLAAQRERIARAAEVTAWLQDNGPATRHDILSEFELGRGELARMETEGLVSRSRIIADPKPSNNLRFDWDTTVAAVARVWEKSGYKDSGDFFSGVTYDQHRGDADPSRALISIKWSWVQVAKEIGIPTKRKRRVYRKRWTDEQILGWVHGFAVWAEQQGVRMTFIAYQDWAQRTAGAPCGATVRNQMRNGGTSSWTSIILEATKQQDQHQGKIS